MILITTVPLRLMHKIPEKLRLALICCFLFYERLQSIFYDFHSGQPWPIEGTPPLTATSTGPMWGYPPPPPPLDPPARAAGGCTRETTTYAVPIPQPPATPPPTLTTTHIIRNLGRVSVLIFFLNLVLFVFEGIDLLWCDRCFDFGIVCKKFLLEYFKFCL